MGWKGTITLTYELSVTFDGTEERPESHSRGSRIYGSAEEALEYSQYECTRGLDAKRVSRELKAAKVESLDA